MEGKLMSRARIYKRRQKDEIVIERAVSISVRHVKEDWEETLKIERRKRSLISRLMPEANLKWDVECAIEMMTDILHMAFTWNMDKTERAKILLED